MAAYVKVTSWSPLPKLCSATTMPRSRERGALMTALGPPGLVDAAGVVGLFNAIDRVADAIGIPLEPEKAAASADFRAALELDRFSVADRV
jgi:hypothetical protein